MDVKKFALLLFFMFHRELLQGRQPRWTESIAVGSEGFVEQTKSALGIKAVGREVIGGDGVYELREPVIPYSLDSTDENGDLRQKNTYFWDISA